MITKNANLVIRNQFMVSIKKMFLWPYQTILPLLSGNILCFCRAFIVSMLSFSVFFHKLVKINISPF